MIDNLNVIAKHVADNQNSLYKDKDSVLLSLLQTNASKVIDANGEPLVIYHGTKRDFTEFDTSQKSPTGTGSFFTTNRETAEQYAGKVNNRRNFVVAIQMDTAKGRISVNSIRSVHYRSSNSHIANGINKGLLEYVDKTKISDWFSKQRYNSAEVRKSFRDATKIVENFENLSSCSRGGWGAILRPFINGDREREIDRAVRSIKHGIS